MAAVVGDTMVSTPKFQLPLEIRLRDDATFANFLVPASAQPLLDALQAQTQPQGEPLLFLCGPAGGGKSHLLQACCQAADAQALYLPLAELVTYNPDDVLQGVELASRVCLDDMQVVAGHEAWEAALFHLINRARQRHCRLVFAADGAPRALGINLPDLQSRLSGGLVIQLPRPDDAHKAQILQFRAERRGLSLPQPVAAYIVSRAPRGMEQLLALLERLDEASLAHQRALSKPFVKQTLQW